MSHREQAVTNSPSWGEYVTEEPIRDGRELVVSPFLEGPPCTKTCSSYREVFITISLVISSSVAGFLTQQSSLIFTTKRGYKTVETYRRALETKMEILHLLVSTLVLW